MERSDTGAKTVGDVLISGLSLDVVVSNQDRFLDAMIALSLRHF